MNKKPENISIDEPTPENLKLLTEVFQRIEGETANVAEMIFDYLIDIMDDQIMTGEIPAHPNPKVNAYIKILNRLFLLSRKNANRGGFSLINRKTVKDLDKKLTQSACVLMEVCRSIFFVILLTLKTKREPRQPRW